MYNKITVFILFKFPDLINEHKSVHGDTPFSGVEQRQPEAPTSARVHSTSFIHPHSSRGRIYAPQSHASWRKTYSLKNKNPQSSHGRPSASTTSFVHQSSSHSISNSASLPSHSRGEESERTANLSSGISPQKREGHVSSITLGIGGAATEKKHTDSALRKTGTSVSQHEDGKGHSSSAGTSMQHRTFHRQTQEVQKKSESSHEVLPGKKVSAPSEVSSSVKANSSTSLQSKPSLTSKTSTEIKQTVNTTTPVILTAGNTGPSLSAASKVLKQASINPTSHTSQGQVSASFPKKSKFTWVKSQNVGGVEPTQASSMSSPTGKAVAVAPASVSKTGGATGSSPLFAANKRTPAKKLPRKLSPVTVAPKTSKYKWVSSSAGAQAKISRKLLSPKALTLSQRALEKGEATKKLKAASAPSAKIKKGTAGSPNSSSLSSRYRWKAGGQSTSAGLTGGAARRRSAFHWTSEKSSKAVKGGLVGSPSVTQRTSLTPSSSPGGFKLRSRMKIIRKPANR